MTINWKQVLEIESYVNKIFEENATIERFIWRHPQEVNSGLRVDKGKDYSFYDLQSYLTTKYPKDELIKQGNEMIKELFLACASGMRVSDIEEELLDLNANQEKYILSKESLKLSALNESTEFTGCTSYFLMCLKSLVEYDKHSYLSINDRASLVNKLQSDFIAFIKQIHEFNFENISFKFIDANSKYTVPGHLTNSFKKLMEGMNRYIADSRFTSMMTSTRKNNYVPPYSREDAELFISDAFNFSIREVLALISFESNNLLAFKIRANESPYPEDFRTNNFGNINVFITLHGLINFDQVTKLKSDGRLLEYMKSLFEGEFKLLNKFNVATDYGPESRTTGNRMDSSIIIGKNNTLKRLYNQHIDDWQEMVTTGFIWFHDDVHGLIYDNLGFHDKTDYQGESEYSFPFENVLTKYLIAYLEKTEYDWNDEEKWQEEGFWISKEEYQRNNSDEWYDEDDNDA